MNKIAYFKLMERTELLKKAAEEKPAKEEDKKAKKQEKKDKDQPSESKRRSTGKYHSELVGQFTSPLVTSAAFAGLGKLLGGKQGAIGGAVGGLSLGALSNLFGGLSGIIAGPRTLARQGAYNASIGDTILNYLAPGKASFNKARTRATKDEQDARIQELLQRLS